MMSWVPPVTWQLSESGFSIFGLGGLGLREVRFKTRLQQIQGDVQDARNQGTRYKATAGSETAPFRYWRKQNINLEQISSSIEFQK